MTFRIMAELKHSFLPKTHVFFLGGALAPSAISLLQFVYQLVSGISLLYITASPCMFYPAD